MNILELDSFDLADAVKFNNELNPRIWQGNKMRPEVREKLLEIAEDFREFLGVDNLDVRDITVSGSNASYHYTPYSDIDLHLVVDVPKLNDDAIFRELFDAKKYQYNDLHNIKIGGYDVELYVEDAGKPPVSQGIFSVLNNDWINIPRQRRATVDDTAVKSKYEDIKHRIESALKDKDFDRIDRLAKKIKAYRQAGLDKHGEFGPENIAFKMLRNHGLIGKLYDARNAARDAELSLNERKKKKKRVKYGFARTWGPVFDFGDSGEGGDGGMAEDATATPDGVNPTTCMFLNEKEMPNHTEIIFDFMKFVVHELDLHNVPKLKIRKDPQWSVINKSFGRYRDDLGQIDLATGNRHIMDVLRTLAHELQHRKQDEREHMPPNAGATGSRFENEAHAVAGVLMRKYADLHPEYFEDVPVNESSGYIPTKAQANDPRFKMALTVDVHPGQTGQEANKMALKTDKQGKPELLIKSANLLKEFKEFKAGIINEDEDLFEVKMTSKNLAKLARDIKGATVGLEFEMIVPNTQSNDGGDMEPNYAEDERVNDIDDACNFFDDGDYNDRSTIRRLRADMEEQFFEWQMEKIDELWNGNQGWEFFTEYLDREDPFDEDEAREEATNELQAQYGDDITPEEFEKMLTELVNEKAANYTQEQWDEQGRNYDYAREEFEEEQRDDLTQSDWLDSQGIRYMSDVESTFGHVTWPYWENAEGDDTDIKEVALNFMNYMGYDTIAVGEYHGYGGGYQLWNGSEWRKIGSNKPMDAFTVEPDGSLSGDSSSDTGLEFVSPPIPLDQIGETMRKVQQWAGEYGAYTGKNNATSMHTNISVPNYDLDKLDYLKAAILLGDEYVLREFGRIGNSYAKPAIEKVKNLVKQKPEKAQELLDKMKSQLNAEASKLIHSGQTDKYTSINTKDNRVEFRSPGGDYLTDIADNPQKMIDTVNRMVVALDAAMDPNKYKQEYQKKLYKLLTGQAGGREAATGKKQEMKASDKDLINIFTRYAAGELPKQALKSFVRQAQLERNIKAGKTGGEEFKWEVGRPGYGASIIVNAKTREEAIDRALQPDGYPDWASARSQLTAKPIGPANTNAVRARAGEPQPVGQQPEIPGSNIYRITDTRGGLIAGDEYDNDQAALERAAYWAQRRGVDVVVKNARGEEVGRVSASGEITPATQPSSGQGNWGIWMLGADRFANQPGEYPRGATPPLYRFPSKEAAEQWIEQQRSERPRMRTDIEVREIEPAEPIPGSTLDLQRQRAAAAQTSAGEPSSYELYRVSDGRTVIAPAGNPIVFRATSPEDAESKIERYVSDFGLGSVSSYAVRSVINSPTQQEPAMKTYELYDRNTGTVIDTFPARNDNEAMIRLNDFRDFSALARQNPQWDVGVRQQVSSRAQQSIWYVSIIGRPGTEIQVQANSEEDARVKAMQARFDIFGDESIGNIRASTVGVTQAPQTPDQAQGGIVDVAGEQPTADNWSADFERRMQQPAAGGSFTGEWKVVDPNGREIYRFGGVGNSQSDANRVAMAWLQRNPRQMQAGVEVLPVMG